MALTSLPQIDHDTEKVMRLIAETIASVRAPHSTPWSARIVLGLWSVRHLPYAAQYLPAFPIVHIGFSLRYASQFFAVPRAGFNILVETLLRPGSGRFLRRARGAARPVFAWTVDDPGKMEWCIRQGLDGVITDDPKLFREISDEFDESRPARWMTFHALFMTIKMWFLMVVYGRVFYRNIDRPKPPVVIIDPKKGNTELLAPDGTKK